MRSFCISEMTERKALGGLSHPVFLFFLVLPASLSLAMSAVLPLGLMHREWAPLPHRP